MIGSIAIFMCPSAVEQLHSLGPTAPGSDDAMGAAVMVALMGLCSLVFAVTRATAVRRTFATSRHKTAAEPALIEIVARRQRVRTFAFAAGCVFAGLLIARLPLEPDVRLMLEVTPMLMLMVALVSLWRLQPLLHIGRSPDVMVSSHGQFLYAAHGARLVGWVAAPTKLIARATALPVALLLRSSRTVSR